MYTIKKMRADHVIDFAAEELKKYLWMMMPECDDIAISYEPDAKDGFRLGLLEDFGLPNEATNVKLDDVIHVDTDEQGGILAGSNPRSVLFAVYRFLRLNGCRWLFAGPDGEYIPRQAVTAQNYHKLADHRFRGHTTEGDPSFEQVLDYIDFHAKQELNFYGPMGIHTYHYRYYNHDRNDMNRDPEPVSASLVDQWKGVFLAELKKRGMFLKDGEHGQVAQTIGIEPFERAAYKKGEKVLTEEQKSKVAMIGGKRDLFRKDIYYTNLCLSRPELRTKYVQVLADFAESHRHIDLIGLSFADGNHNHCECENCRGRRPSEYLVMIANELDEELTKRGVDTMFNFSTYVDMMFAPQVEKIKNPDRFYIQFTPITRSYTGSITENTVFPEPGAYHERNVWDAPKSIEDCAAHLLAWRKNFPGPCYGYEYHFWRAQYRDPGLMDISRRVYEDILSLKLMDMQGYLQDGSNMSFFPHGFHGHIYAEALMDRDCDYDATMEDCVAHLQAWRKQFDGPCTTFEYHFWRAQIRDPGLMYISRRVYEDIMAFRLLNIQGITEDGSNKHFFPHGFHEHIYAEVLLDQNCDYDEAIEDYFSHLYGKDWKQVKAYMDGISEAFGEKYMAGEDSADPKKGTHYNPARAAKLEYVYELAATARALAKKHKSMPTRPQTVAYRLLGRHAEYCERLADVFIAKCQGFDKLAVEKMRQMIADYGKYEFELERYLDYGLAMRTLEVVANQMPTIEF